MKLVSQFSPIAIHFGSLETRLLQLQGGPGGWSVRVARTFAAQGKNRHWQAGECIKEDLRSLRIRGKDVTIAMSGEEVAVQLVPIDDSNRGRLQETLQETASTAVEDPEGVVYRFLPMTSTLMGGGRASEEFLLLTVGSSEIRRCTDAVTGIGLRSVGLEMNAFPIARALQAIQQDADEPWGFLHLGFGHSLFGIMHRQELSFLKPLQIDGRRLMVTLQRTLNRNDDGGEGPELMDILAGGASEAPARKHGSHDAGQTEGEESSHRTVETAFRAEYDPNSLEALTSQAVGHSVEVLHALRMEAEALAQEIRACLRHFANRNKGARVERVTLGGFGANLPEVETAISKALTIQTDLARPFTDLEIKAPKEVLDEEHLWCTALGLAMRGYE